MCVHVTLMTIYCHRIVLLHLMMLHSYDNTKLRVSVWWIILSTTYTVSTYLWINKPIFYLLLYYLETNWCSTKLHKNF